MTPLDQLLGQFEKRCEQLRLATHETRVKYQKGWLSVNLKKCASKRQYYVVFSKLAKDPHALFDNKTHAQRYVEQVLKVNVNTKLRIETVTNVTFL
jgi:hypothetical protein